MRIVTLGGKKFTLELDWNTLEIEGPRMKAVKLLLSQPEHQGIKRGIILENEGQLVIGLASEEEKTVAPSAAAWLAEANRVRNEELDGDDEKIKNNNWIVIENLGIIDDGSQSQSGQESFWFSVIQDGLPLPGADLIMSWDEIVLHLNGMIGSQSSLYTVYSKDERIQSAFGSRANIFDQGFLDLIKDVKFRKKIKPLTGVPMPVVITVVSVFILILIYLAYSHFEKQHQLNEALAAQSAAAQKVAQQQAAEKAQYQKKVQELVFNTYKEGLQSLNESLDQGDPSQTLNAWANIIDSIPLSHEGWQMSGIQCDVAGRIPECQVKLSRGDFGINRTLAQYFPNVQFDGDKAYYVIRGSQLPERENHLQNIVGGRTLSLGLLSDLQTLRPAGIQYNLAASSEIDKEITLPAKKTGPIALKKKGPQPKYEIHYGVAFGNLSLQGNQIWQIQNLAKFVNSPALVLKDITLNVSTSSLKTATWTMDFVYFIRTAPYPVLPNIPEANYPGGPVDPATGKTILASNKMKPDYTPGGLKGSVGSAVKLPGSSESNSSESNNGSENQSFQNSAPVTAYPRQPTIGQAPVENQNYAAPVQGLPPGG